MTRQLGSYLKVRCYCCEGDMGDLPSDAIRNVFQNNHILIGYSRQIHELLTRGKNCKFCHHVFGLLLLPALISIFLADFQNCCENVNGIKGVVYLAKTPSGNL